jgi:hypothetical protein
MSDGADIFGDVKNLQRALGVQGQLLLDKVRSDMGVLLTHDVAWYLRQQQQRYSVANASPQPVAAGPFYNLMGPLQVNAKIISMSLTCAVVADVANLTGAIAGLIYSDIATQMAGSLSTDYIPVPLVSWTSASTAQFNNTAGRSNVAFRPTFMAQNFPVYAPAGTSIVLRYQAAAAFAGPMFFNCVYVNTANLDLSAGSQPLLAGSERMEPIT